MQALIIQSGPNEAAPQPVQAGSPVQGAAGQNGFSFDALLEQAAAGITDGNAGAEQLLQGENPLAADFPAEAEAGLITGRFLQLTHAGNSELRHADELNGKKSAGKAETDAEFSVLPGGNQDKPAAELLADRREDGKFRVKKDGGTADDSLAALFGTAAPKNAPTDKTGADIEGEAEKSAASAADAKIVLNQIPAISVDDRRTRGLEKDSGLQTSVAVDKNGSAEMTLTLASQTPQNTAGSDGLPVKNAQNFSHMLSQEIQNNAAEFVKTGSIILRDNNAGTINMVLHPQELGNVKIKLELSDKIITGKITVETLEAFNAFKSNLQTLRTAFTENGFTGAGFELNWSGSNAGGQGGEGGQQRGDERNPHARFYSELMPPASFSADERSAAYAFGAVNVMA